MNKKDTVVNGAPFVVLFDGAVILIYFVIHQIYDMKLEQFFISINSSCEEAKSLVQAKRNELCLVMVPVDCRAL